MKFIFVFLFVTILTGCNSVPIEHDLPYGDTDAELEIEVKLEDWIIIR